MPENDFIPVKAETPVGRARRAWCLRSLAAGAALATALAAPAARAQEESHVTSAADAANKALVLVKKGQFEDARKLYEEAYQYTPTTLLLFNLGLAELSAGHGHELDALRHFHYYLNASDAEPQKVAVIKSDLLPRAYRMTGHIGLDHKPAGTTVILDGVQVGALEDTLDTAPGSHELIVEAPKGNWRASVNVAAGDRVDAQFVQDPAPAAAAPPPSVHPAIEATNTASRPADAGSEPSRWNTKNIIGISVLGLAVVTELSVFGVMIDQQNADSTLKGIKLGSSTCQNPPASLAGQCGSYNSAMDRFNRDNTLYPVLLISGGAMTALAGILVLLVPSPKPEASREKNASITVRPTFDPMSRSAGLVGSF